MSIEKESHAAHSGWYEVQYATQEAQKAAIDRRLHERAQNTITNWLHERQYALAAPFVASQKTWLTLGDGYGFDANHFYEKGLDVTATDIAGTFLPQAKAHGLLKKYSIENAEKLSFEDSSFDYIFCKESYHHFPRPYLAVYEMIRVAREAVILIEPHDPISKMPLLLAMRNLMDRWDTRLLQKYWKNRYSFEEVGNYVFKLSEREMDKLANGMGLPAVAFKGINNNYYHPALASEKADDSSPVFKKLKRKIAFHDFLVKASFMPSQVLCAVIFKKMPSPEVQQAMTEEAFTFYVFPVNPYSR